MKIMCVRNGECFVIIFYGYMNLSKKTSLWVYQFTNLNRAVDIWSFLKKKTSCHLDFITHFLFSKINNIRLETDYQKSIYYTK